MNEELKVLIDKTSNREGLARIFDHLADRLDAVVAERRHKAPERRHAEVPPDVE